PYYIDLNQDLYVQANLHSSDRKLKLFVDTCVASPDPHAFNNIMYKIIENGCPEDPSYVKHNSSDNHVVRFEFKTFEFIDRHPSVYLGCELMVCRADDSSSRCYQGCVSRSKREASS
ncbi:Deleted in malignant brain tumors 1 protein, partial [Mesitornis unicolor]